MYWKIFSAIESSIEAKRNLRSRQLSYSSLPKSNMISSNSQITVPEQIAPPSPNSKEELLKPQLENKAKKQDSMENAPKIQPLVKENSPDPPKELTK